MGSRYEQAAMARLLEHPVLARVQAFVRDRAVRSVYLVGGAIRDAWLGRETQDFDFAVAEGTQEFARDLAQALGARYVLLDEEWGVVRLVWSPSGKDGEIVWLDFAPMRGSGIEEDLLQRDFTCNAVALPMAGSPGSRVWIDPLDGLSDLRAGTLRMVHPLVLRQDPVRLLRGFRLSCTLGLEIEPSTRETIRGESALLGSAPGERVREELFKTLTCPESLPCILDMDDTGILGTILPELEALKGLPQGGFHHLDGWGHTLEAYRILEQGLREDPPAGPAAWLDRDRPWIARNRQILPLLKLAVLLHDVGKPATRSTGKDGHIHFIGHAGKGAEIAASVMKRLRAGRREGERLAGWIRRHMAPLQMMNALRKGTLTEKGKIRFLMKLQDDAVPVLLIGQADLRATRGPEAGQERDRAFQELLDSLEPLYSRMHRRPPGQERLLSGRDLMEALDLDPGPLVGRLLRLIEEARMEGRINSRSDALRFARSLRDKLARGNPG